MIRIMKTRYSTNLADNQRQVIKKSLAQREKQETYASGNYKRNSNNI